MGRHTSVLAIDEPIRNVRAPQLCKELGTIRLESLPAIQRRMVGSVEINLIRI
jgi:hypothetical protein